MWNIVSSFLAMFLVAFLFIGANWLYLGIVAWWTRRKSSATSDPERESASPSRR